jgi:hypothetical protein
MYLSLQNKGSRLQSKWERKSVSFHSTLPLQEWSALDRRLLQDDARRGNVSGLRRAISTTRRSAFLGALILSNWSTPRKLKPLVNSGRTWASHTLTHNVQSNNGTVAKHLMERRIWTFLSAQHRAFVSSLTVSTCSRNFAASWKPNVNRLVTFLVSWGGVSLSPLGMWATIQPIVPVPDDEWWWVSSSRWNEWKGKPKYSERTCPIYDLSTTNPTGLDLGSNAGRREGRPTTNRLIYGKTKVNREPILGFYLKPVESSTSCLISLTYSFDIILLQDSTCHRAHNEGTWQYGAIRVLGLRRKDIA